MLKLKFQHFGHLMWRANWLSKTWERLRAREEGGDRGWDDWMVFPTQWPWVRAETGRWWRSGKPGVLQFMGSQSWIRLSNWTTTCQSRGAVFIGSFLSQLPLDHLALSISPMLSSFFFFLVFYFLNFKIFNSYMRSQTWTPLPPPSPQHLCGSSPCSLLERAPPSAAGHAWPSSLHPWSVLQFRHTIPTACRIFPPKWTQYVAQSRIHYFPFKFVS